MKFSEIEYKRPDMNALRDKFNQLIEIFDSANSFEVQDEIMKEINNLRLEYQTYSTIAGIKYSIDTSNKEYEDEQNFYDSVGPDYEGLITKYYQSIIKSKFRKELEEKWGKQLFDVAAVTIKTFSPEIIEDLKIENELRTDYTKLLASAKIWYDGEEKNLDRK